MKIFYYRKLKRNVAEMLLKKSLEKEENLAITSDYITRVFDTLKK